MKTFKKIFAFIMAVTLAVVSVMAGWYRFKKKDIL